MLQRAKRMSATQAWVSAFVDNKQLQDEVLKRVKSRLTEKGTNDKGKVIGTYSPFTEKVNRKKRAGSHYTLFDTGEFYQSLYIGALSDYFFIDGDGDKGKENLFTKFGDGIIGLTEEDKDWLGEKVIEKYYEYAREVLQRD